MNNGVELQPRKVILIKKKKNKPIKEETTEQLIKTIRDEKDIKVQKPVKKRVIIIRKKEKSEPRFNSDRTRDYKVNNGAFNSYIETIKFRIYTDGSWIKQDAIGSYAYLIIKDKFLTKKNTNRNRNTRSNIIKYNANAYFSIRINIEIMELLAVIKGIKYIKTFLENSNITTNDIDTITVISDNLFVADFYNRYKQLVSRQWVFNNGKYIPKEVIGIYTNLYELCKEYNIIFTKVKAHAKELKQKGLYDYDLNDDHYYNDKVDRLCKIESSKLKQDIHHTFDIAEGIIDDEDVIE
jgi:ribonuclease HI